MAELPASDTPNTAFMMKQMLLSLHKDIQSDLHKSMHRMHRIQTQVSHLTECSHATEWKVQECILTHNELVN